MRRLAVSIVVAAAALAVASCGGTVDAHRSHGHVSSMSSRVVIGSADDELVGLAKAQAELAKTMREPWPRTVRRYKVVRGVLWIETSMRPGTKAVANARKICDTMKTAIKPFPGVSIRDAEGARIVQALKSSAPCT